MLAQSMPKLDGHYKHDIGTSPVHGEKVADMALQLE